jgi:hypothetical protein
LRRLGNRGRKSQSKSASQIFSITFFLTHGLLLILETCAKRMGDTNCDLWPAERRYCVVGNPARMPG